MAQVKVSKEQGQEIAEEDTTQQDTARKTRESKIKKREEKLEDIDDLLDEIDTILEETAVQATYRQRGGE